MNAGQVALAVLVTTVLGSAVLYVVIRMAVTDALRSERRDRLVEEEEAA